MRKELLSLLNLALNMKLHISSQYWKINSCSFWPYAPIRESIFIFRHRVIWNETLYPSEGFHPMFTVQKFHKEDVPLPGIVDICTFTVHPQYRLSLKILFRSLNQFPERQPTTFSNFIFMERSSFAAIFRCDTQS